MTGGLTVSEDRGGRTRGMRLAPRVRRRSRVSKPCSRLIGGRQVSVVRHLVGRLPRGRQLVVRLESVRKRDCGRVTGVLGLARRRMGIGLFETERGMGRECLRVSRCKLWMCEATFETVLTV